MALELVECTHCHYKFRTDIGKQVDEGETTVYRNFLTFWKPKIRSVKTIDIMCPNCKKEFEIKVVT